MMSAIENNFILMYPCLLRGIKKFINNYTNLKECHLNNFGSFIYCFTGDCCCLCLPIKARKNRIEPYLVKKIVESTNNKKIDVKNTRCDISITSRSFFVHGYQISELDSKPSGVEFKIPENSKIFRKELADLILLSGFFVNNKPYFGKITLTQVKTGKDSYKIDIPQLYLLSRFPEFRGVKNSIIPQSRFRLNNRTKRLGSHLLVPLRIKGDYFGWCKPKSPVFLSSNLLERMLSFKKTIDISKIKNQSYRTIKVELFNELVREIESYSVSDSNTQFYYEFWKMTDKIANNAKKGTTHGNISQDMVTKFRKTVIFNSSLLENDITSFLELYLSGLIGEPFSYLMPQETKTTIDLIKNVMIPLAKEYNGYIDKDLKELVGGDPIDPSSIPEKLENEDQGIGVIYVKVNLTMK